MTGESVFNGVAFVVGLLVSTLLVLRQMRQQRSLSYVTNLLQEKDVAAGYKAFLQDTRAVWNTLEVFPRLRVDEGDVGSALLDADKKKRLSHIVQYMRDALLGGDRAGNEYLKRTFPRLVRVLKETEGPDDVFKPENLKDIEGLIREALTKLTFCPGEAWFLALFASAPKAREAICDLVATEAVILQEGGCSAIEREAVSIIMGKCKEK